MCSQQTGSLFSASAVPPSNSISMDLLEILLGDAYTPRHSLPMRSMNRTVSEWCLVLPRSGFPQFHQTVWFMGTVFPVTLPSSINETANVPHRCPSNASLIRWWHCMTSRTYGSLSPRTLPVWYQRRTIVRARAHTHTQQQQQQKTHECMYITHMHARIHLYMHTYISIEFILGHWHDNMHTEN